MKNIKKQIETYTPYNQQEKKDRMTLLFWIDTGMDLFTRENSFAHWTASAWVVNQNMDRVLMVYHNIYDSWSWLGGHADGDEDLLHVAIKEVKEESGLQNVHPLSQDIFSLEILTVDGHVKKGQYVSSHLHLNVTYLLMADDSQKLTIAQEENSGVRWFTPDEALQASSEPWFVKHVYSKLNEKLRKYQDGQK